MLQEPLPRRGPWTSKQLGIPYPYVNKIYIGVCGCKEYEGHGSKGPWDESINGVAHAHVCHKDPARGMICVSDLKFLYSYNGLASSTLWHEYAHLLENGEEFPCPHSNSEYLANFEAIQKQGHGIRWRNIMRALGQHVSWNYFDSREEYEQFFKIGENEDSATIGRDGLSSYITRVYK